MIEIKAEINYSLYNYYDISHSKNKVVILTDPRQGFLQGLNVRNCEKLSLNIFGYGICKLPTSTVDTSVHNTFFQSSSILCLCSFAHLNCFLFIGQSEIWLFLCNSA